MAPLLPAAAWLCAAAVGSVAVESGVRFGARGRETRVEGVPGPTIGELEVVPRLALLSSGRLALTVSYTPRFTLPVDVSAGAPELTRASELRDRGEILQRGDASAEIGATPNLTLRLRGDGAYGRIDLLRLEVYRNEVIPPAGRLAWISARASAEAIATPTRRTTVSAAVVAFEMGGADAAARAAVPLQRGVRAEGSLRYGATRRDEVALVADASRATVTPVTPAADTTALVRLGGRWAHRPAPTLAASVTFGAAWSYADALVATHEAVMPYAEVGLSHTPERPPMTTEIALGVSPYMSVLDGSVDQRLEARAGSTWRAGTAWELALRAAASTTRRGTSGGAFWTGARHADLASAELRATWEFAERGSVSLAGRGRSQQGHDPSTVSFVEWGAAVELTFGARWTG